MTVQTEFDYALGLHQAGRLAEAEEIYRRILLSEPDHAGALHLLGVARQQQGDHSAALELIGRAVALNPTKAVYRNNYGAALQSLGRYEEGVASFQRALEICLQYPDALANLGMAQASLGQDADAVASFHEALSLQPGHRDAMKRLTALVQTLGPGEEANSLYEKALPGCSATEIKSQYKDLSCFIKIADRKGKAIHCDHLIFDGKHHYSYDKAGNRTSRYEKDADGNQINVTAYDWDGQNRLVRVRQRDADGRCSEEVFSGGDTTRANVRDGQPYVGENPYVNQPHGEDAVGRSVDGTGPSQAAEQDCSPTTCDQREDRFREQRPTSSGQKSPLISVIMPVYNGKALVERALRSLQAQTFGDWELLAIDDASSDDTHKVLERWAAADPRINIVRLAENSGASAARNAGLRLARGEFIAYLDHDDEYYPNFLEQIAAVEENGDVLVFRFDVAENDAPQQDGTTWDPVQFRRIISSFNPVAPMAVAHRRSLLDKTGGFNELVWMQEDWDLWKRLARTGAKFAFFPFKSGRYNLRAGSLSHAPRLTVRQRKAIEANWQAGRPILTSPTATTRCEPVRKIAFVSPHCLIDSASGAAAATLDGLQMLSDQGFECQAFCGTRLDGWPEVLVEEVLSRRKAPYTACNARIGPFAGRMIFTRHGTVPVTLFNTASTRGGWLDEEEVAAFMTACEIFLRKQLPDVVWTYGGAPVSRAVYKLVKRLDIPMLFALHGLSYSDPSLFHPMDYAVAPSDFARQHYWNTLGLACQKLPLLVDPRRVQMAQWRPQYVTFVNPEPRKGVHVFARIAEVLAARRSDIPLLLVEGASTASFLPELGIDLSRLNNLTIMPNTPDARNFHAVTKIMLMPSLELEDVGLVAAEAMLNGIPVVASTRGALPETVGDAGFLLDIPAHYATESGVLPTAEEVEPWVQTIVRLWDDAAYYAEWSGRARRRAEQWRPERLTPLYRKFFSGLCHQPGAPLVPKEEFP